MAIKPTTVINPKNKPAQPEAEVCRHRCADCGTDYSVRTHGKLTLCQACAEKRANALMAEGKRLLHLFWADQ
ncbi:MAG: hypothetical protein ACP5I8_00715 [Phycisphaerae bacterium]